MVESASEPFCIGQEKKRGWEEEEGMGVRGGGRRRKKNGERKEMRGERNGGIGTPQAVNAPNTEKKNPSTSFLMGAGNYNYLKLEDPNITIVWTLFDSCLL